MALHKNLQYKPQPKIDCQSYKISETYTKQVDTERATPLKSPFSTFTRDSINQ